MHSFIKILVLLTTFFHTHATDSYSESDSDSFGVIINGNLADIRNYPYYAYLAYNQRDLKCGGAIIKTDVIVTAAHCLDKSNFVVYTGITKADDLKSRYPYQVKNIIKYHKYRGEAAYDIGLVRLTRHIKLGPNARVISVAQSNPWIGSSVSVVGFGKKDCNHKVWKDGSLICGGANSEHLRSSFLKVISYAWGIMYTGTSSNQNTCYGDSGGPVVYGNKLVGLVSTGQYADCTGYDTQVAVAYYYKWIQANLKYFCNFSLTRACSY